MKLFIIRHGDAGHETGTGDEYRSLSDTGGAQVKRLAACCNRLGISFDQVWSSNLLRAEETAERLAHHMDGSPPVLFNDCLVPPGDFNDLRGALRSSQRSSIAIVGHMPFLGECLQYWIGGNAHPGIELNPCSLVALNARGFNRHQMTLEFVINDFIASGVLNGVTVSTDA
jgi:phosphohistidine phosphatase SixA